MKLKDKIQAALSEIGEITFKVYLELVMRVVELNYHGEHANEIKDWIAYGGLYQSIGNDLYNFNGKIIKEGDDIAAWVRFNRPFEGEFEPIEIFTDLNLLKEIVSGFSNSVSIETLDPQSLYVSFEYSEDEGFSSFTATYLPEDNSSVAFHELLNEDQMLKLQGYFKEIIIANVPRLDVSQNINQHWVAECAENNLRYGISKDYFKVEDLDFELSVDE